MSDFEERLSRALAEGAEEAPIAAGLAEGARRRSRERRRARVMVIGAAVAVAAIAVPVGIVLGSDGDERLGPADGSPSAPSLDDPWQIVEAGGTEVALPPGWTESVREGCDPSFTGDATNLRIFCVGSGEIRLVDGPVNLDIATGPGELRDGHGYVLIGDDHVIALGLTRDLAQRILGSAQPSRGSDRSTAPWRSPVPPGCPVDVPPDTEVDVTCGFVRGTVTPEPARRQTDGRWVATGAPTTRSEVRVVAPTQAIADLVAASARIEEDPEVGWQQVTESDATFEVPSDWTSPPGCTGAGTAPTYGPGGGAAPCREMPGVFVYFEPTFDPAVGSGPRRCDSQGWCGYRIAGSTVIFVRGVDRATAVRLLDSVTAPPR